MELHSYAKRRTTKKWTFEQKRKLVEARISHDVIFMNEPRNSVLPWKKILALAKLDDFNVFFVRKQWSNMVAKYKQYKVIQQNRLGNIPTQSIDNEMIQKITQEWEYFQPIHHFMTRKTTNLHSYASTRREPQQTDTDTQYHDYAQWQKQQQTLEQDNQASTSSMERANQFSSDTNDDFATRSMEEFQQVETDREFYWHQLDDGDDMNGVRECDDGENATMDDNSNDIVEHGVDNKKDSKPTPSYFADASEDTQESLITKSHPIVTTQAIEKLRGEEFVENMHKISEITSTHTNIGAKSTSTTTTFTTSSTKTATSASSVFVDTNQIIKIDEELLIPQEQISNAGDDTGGNSNHVREDYGNAKRAQLESTFDHRKRKQQQHIPKRIQTAKTSTPPPQPSPPIHMSERDKYYRHKRRFNRRIERRFDSLLNVFGQIIRAEYPSIDTSPLLSVSAAATKNVIINTLFSSDDNDENNVNSNSSSDDNSERKTVLSNRNVGDIKTQKQPNDH